MYKDKSKSPSIKYNDMITRLSQSTGIGCQTIVRTIAEYKKTITVSSPNKRHFKTFLFRNNRDDLNRSQLRRKVHSVWLHRELPTFDKILLEVNRDPSLPNCRRASMYDTINKLDFIFTKANGCSVLTEKEYLIAWRRNYLYDIKKYREEGRSIYYLDETWLNTSDCAADRVEIDKTVHPEYTDGRHLRPIREND